VSRRVSGFIAALALGLAGCAGARKSPSSLTLYAPCVLSGPIQKLAAAYQKSHPEIRLTTQVEKPLALLNRALASPQGPAVVITTGDVEMRHLAQAGAVDSAAVRTFAANTFLLAVVAPTQGKQQLQKLSDLTRAERIYLEDPSRSTLGARAQQAFQRLGLWDKVRSRVISPDPGAMILAELVAGKADAAVVFKDCLFAEAGKGGSPPRTIRIIADLPPEAYQPIHYQAAPLKSAPPSQAARDFVSFLTSPQGAEALKRAGLTPAPL